MRSISRLPRAASSAACIVGRRLASICAVAALALGAMLPSGPAHAQGCSGDINGDGRVDGIDLATVLSQ